MPVKTLTGPSRPLAATHAANLILFFICSLVFAWRALTSRPFILLPVYVRPPVQQCTQVPTATYPTHQSLLIFIFIVPPIAQDHRICTCTCAVGLKPIAALSPQSPPPARRRHEPPCVSRLSRLPPTVPIPALMADQATAAPSATDPRRSPSPPERMRSSAAEDPDTAAARREFDNTQISEKPDPAANPMTAAAQSAPALAPEARKRKTPELEVPHDSMKDQISSPKKKRAHDELDQNKDTAQDPNGDVSPIGANGSATLSRTDRSEPEKKRPRDISSELKANQPQDSTVSRPLNSPDLRAAPC